MARPLTPPPIRPTVPPGVVPGERRTTWESLLNKPGTGGSSNTIPISALTGQTSTTRQFIRSVGTGTVAGVPAWDTLLPADVTGDVAAGTFPSGTFTFPGSLVAQSLLDLSNTGQIKFKASPASSADNNTIDYYKKNGTWTPADGSGAGLGLTVTRADYLRVGSLVFVRFDVTYPATASGAQATISGLPFTAVGDNAMAPAYCTAPIALFGDCSGTSVFMYAAATAGGAVTNANLASKRLIMSGCYAV
jgi:hypothetical protein